MAASGSGCIVGTATAAILVTGRVDIARKSHIDGHGVGLNRGQSHPGASIMPSRLTTIQRDDHFFISGQTWGLACWHWQDNFRRRGFRSRGRVGREIRRAGHWTTGRVP